MSEWLEVVVESTSPALRYEGDWISAAPSADVLDYTKFHSYPFSQKLATVAEGKTGTLFHNFTGMTRARVEGTVNLFTLTNADAFLIDCNISPQGRGVVVESTTISGNATENLFQFCEARNLVPTETYTLSFSITSLKGQPASFDRILLDPTPSTNLDTATVIMDHRHLMIQYDSGLWDNFNNVAHITNKTQAKMRLKFNGTSVKWYTVWEQPWGTRASDASWQIDDLPFQRFTIPAVDPRFDNLFVEELLFQTPELSHAQHLLEVTYGGEVSSRPLALGNLVIQNSLPTASASASPSPSPSAGGSSPPSNPLPPSSTQAESLSQGAKIAIGVSTSIAGLLVCGALLFLMYRRQRRNAVQPGEIETTHDAPPGSAISPYPSGPASPVMSSKGTPVMLSTSIYSHGPRSPMNTSKGAPIFASSAGTDNSSVSANQEENPPPYQASGSSNTKPPSSSDSPRSKS